MSPFKVEFWLNKGYTELEAKHQIAIRRPSTIEYWKNKGCSEEDAKKKRYEHNTRGTKLEPLIKRFGEIEGTKKYQQYIQNSKENSKRCIEYWTLRGCTKEFAEQKVSELQSTFSRRSCNEKYGVEVGEAIFLARQLKWQHSLKQHTPDYIADMNKRKGQSVRDFIDRHGIDAYLKSKLTNNKLIDYLKICFEKFSTTNEMIIGVRTVIDDISYVHIIFKSAIFREFYNIKITDVGFIKREVLRTFGVVNVHNRKYGYIVLYDGILYNSQGDYKIAKWLTEKNIIFEYNNPYPNQPHPIRSKLRYDFFIPSKNLYIEYTGMLASGSSCKVKNMYASRWAIKQKFILANNLNVVFASDIDNLFELILEKI